MFKLLFQSATIITRTLLLIIGLFSLGVGGLIYFCLRKQGFLLLSWFGYSKYNPFFCERVYHFFIQNRFGEWIIYSFPDGIWPFALTNFLLAIYSPFKIKSLFLITLFAFIISLTHEICQLVLFCKGTFDSIDILTIFLFWILALLNYNIIRSLRCGKKTAFHC